MSYNVYSRWDIWWLIILCCIIPIKSFASTTAECGDHRNVGNSILLSCTVTGSIQNGITWFRGNKPVIRCTIDKNCTSVDPVLYRVWTDYQFHISNASEEDFSVNWSCLDSNTKPATGVSSRSMCTLRKKIPAITKVECGTKSSVGHSKVLRCNALSTIRYGIRWFRSGENIVRCYKDGSCVSLKPEQYKLLTQSDPTIHQMIIRNVTVDDLKQNWTCIDSDEIYTPLPDSSTCQIHSENSLVDCGSKTAIGESHELSCKVFDSTSVNIYRNQQIVLKCSSNIDCNVVVNDGLYRYSKSQDNTEIRLKFKVSQNDIEAKWTCGTSFLNAQPSCKLKGSAPDKKLIGNDWRIGIIVVGVVCVVVVLLIVIISIIIYIKRKKPIYPNCKALVPNDGNEYETLSEIGNGSRSDGEQRSQTDTVSNVIKTKPNHKSSNEHGQATTTCDKNNMGTRRRPDTNHINGSGPTSQTHSQQNNMETQHENNIASGLKQPDGPVTNHINSSGPTSQTHSQ